MIYEQCVNQYSDRLNKMYITEIDDGWIGDDNSKYFFYSHLLNTMELIKERTEPTNTRIYDPLTNEYIVKYIDLQFKVYQNKCMVNNDEYQYLHNLETVMDEGRDYESRNGVVKSMFGTKMILI